MRSRVKRVPGGELEHTLLAALWSRKTATARELHELVGSPRGVIYTTVAKVLDRLFAKRLVARRRVGRAFVYHATVLREETQRQLARTMVTRLAGDDPRPAMAALVGAIEDLDPQLLDELAALIESRRNRDGA